MPGHLNKLRIDSLQWAIKHVNRENDSDLFPRPFELDILNAKESFVLDRLKDIDISSYVWGDFRKVLVPKDELSFRRVCQLDPIDSIIFSAIIYEIGQKIEAKRISWIKSTVFSNRFRPTRDGQFYGAENHWNGFWEASRSQAASSSFVAITDITDFYNQIYLHTIENELDRCGVDAFYKTAIKNLLKHLFESVSRGIPTGPHGAHILAELALIPLDNYLIQKSYRFCRYVDDINIFCSTRGAAQVALFDVAAFLDTQKLSLSRHKTDILSKEAFLEKTKHFVIDQPINAEEEEIVALIKRHTPGPYTIIDFSDLPPDLVRSLTKEKVEKIISAYLEEADPDFTRLRWFMRRLAQTGTPTGVDFVVRHIQKLLPAIGDVAKYLKYASKNYRGNWIDIGDSLLSALELEVVQKNEYLQTVLLHLFASIADLNHVERLIDKYQTGGPFAKRKTILAAVQADASEWLKSLKGSITTMDPWTRRAMIFAAKTLHGEEKDFWLKSLKRQYTKLLELTIIDSI